MKKVICCVLASLFVLSVSGQASAADKVMKIGSVNPKERSLSKGMFKFAEIVEKETGGRIKVQVFTDGVLGGDRQTLESLQMGTIHGTTCSTGPISAFVSQFAVFDLPFLFKDKATAYKIVDGPIGQELMDKLPAVGMIGLSYWENGYRHLTNSSREVKTLEDIKGLKVRTMEAKMHVDAWKAMGANPTPMSMTQVYTALEQKVIDGQENPYGNLVAYKLYEVQKYATGTGHVYNASPFLISKKFWDGLTAQDQQIMRKAAQEAGAYQRELSEKEDQESIAVLRSKGMKVTERMNPGEQEKIVAAMKPVYDKYSEELGKDFVAKLLSALK